MIVNGHALIQMRPLEPFSAIKQNHNGVSHGLSEVGYDIRIKQSVIFTPPDPLLALRLWDKRFDTNRRDFKERFERAFFGFTTVKSNHDNVIKTGRTALASSVEQFDVPISLWAELRNKSTHARCFVDATVGTDIEPGWKGFLTIELIFHDNQPVEIEAGSGIAKAVFHEIYEGAQYRGKYQDQPNRPVPAIKA
jgi:dCTP deaminase